MVVAAAKGGFRRDELEMALPRVQEIPFDSDRKRMTTIHRRNGSGSASAAGLTYPSVLAFVKGAPDVILDHCSHIQRAGVAVALTEDGRREVLEQNRSMATNALRVLGVAYRPLAEAPENPQADQLERDLVFVGLLGMIDPARPEVVEAVKIARELASRASWSPATTKTPPRQSPPRSACGPRAASC